MSDNAFVGCIRIHGVKGIKGGAKRKIGYINPCVIPRNSDWVPMYKVFFTTSYSTDAVTPPEPILAGPNEICTETFLVIGPFARQGEIDNLSKYLHTSFFKAALYFGRGSMMVSRDVFRFVPNQDFKSNADIDWAKSISEIDERLFEKYKFTQDEIDFIKKMIKPMD